ncbi:MAG: metallophosphoesterase [Methylocystaceae bacterium]|nr:metallophosphoesterase [Methylocystaceae bacterium]
MSSINLTGPMLFFGGPYSNLEALRALRDVADMRGIAADHCLCSGDVVAYCADAQACVDEICDWGVHVVMGNCEESLGQGQEDCGCGFEEGTACDVLSKQWFTYANAQLTEDARAWMRNLPRSITVRYTPFKMLAVHGGVEEINKFIFESQKAEIAQELEKADVDVVLAGHCGLPFSKKVGDQYWINAGVIGMPANDGQPHTWYCVITPDENGLEVGFYPLSYDYQTTQFKMATKGLATGYRDALATGLWPSLDVLPQVEKMKTDQGLSLKRFNINP